MEYKIPSFKIFHFHTNIFYSYYLYLHEYLCIYTFTQKKLDLVCSLCPWSRTKPFRRNKSEKTTFLFFITEITNSWLSPYNFSWFAPIQESSQRMIRSIPIKAQKS